MGKSDAVRKESAEVAIDNKPTTLTMEEAEQRAQYDLTGIMAPYLNRHLVYPMYEFLAYSGIYDKTQVMLAQKDLLSETGMLDCVIDICRALGEDASHLNEPKAKVAQEFIECGNSIVGLLQKLEDEEETRKIGMVKSVQELYSEWQVDQEAIENLMTFAKKNFETGKYGTAGILLKNFRKISLINSSEDRALHPNQTTIIETLWGSIMSNMLERKLDEVTADVLNLNEYLEVAKISKKELLMQRTWLAHQLIFGMFVPDYTMDVRLYEFFLSDKITSVMALSAPHLFRYAAAAFILEKRLKHVEKDVIHVVNQESRNYCDPVMRFLIALYIDIDFDEAQRQLQLCEMVCAADYFLKPRWAEFQENARLHIFEMYCRIHQSINIGMIAEKLNMTAEEAELWIVKLIQNAKLDARIDSENSRVVMCKAPPSIYHQVIEKTRNLSFRSMMMVSNLEKREREIREGTVTV